MNLIIIVAVCAGLIAVCLGILGIYASALSSQISQEEESNKKEPNQAPVF